MRWKKRIGWDRGSRLYKTALIAILLVVITGLLASFLANNKPLLASENGRWTSPVVKEMLVKYRLARWAPQKPNRNWKTVQYDWAIWPPVPYLPNDQDRHHLNEAPFVGDHLLGTDHLGRDLLSAMIHAIRTDLSIGLFAMLLAAMIGIVLGGLAGFYGDDSVHLSRGQLLLSILFLPLAMFYGFIIWQPALGQAMAQGWLSLLALLPGCMVIFLMIMAIPIAGAKLLPKNSWLSRPVMLPLDMGISRLIEVVVSIPVIYLLIMLVGATGGDSIVWIILAIGLTRWTGIARYIRAEMLAIRNQEFTEAGRALGFSRWRLLMRHAVPNAIPPAIIAIAFGIANAILLESFLAFVGLGMPPELPTWGSLLNEGRQDSSAWWMALFPGIAIFLTVLLFNIIGDQWNDLLAGKSNRTKK